MLYCRGVMCPPFPFPNANTLFLLNSAPQTLNAEPDTLTSTPSPNPSTRTPKSQPLNRERSTSTHKTLNVQPQPTNPTNPTNPNPKPQTPNLKPQNPTPRTRNPKSQTALEEHAQPRPLPDANRGGEVRPLPLPLPHFQLPMRR